MNKRKVFIRILAVVGGFTGIYEVATMTGGGHQFAQGFEAFILILLSIAVLEDAVLEQL